jgi:hypothetical protein
MRGAAPGGVEIDLPRGGAVKGTEDFEDKKTLSSDYHVERIDCV